MIDWIMEYFPIGVFALSAVNFAQYGVELFGPYLRIAGCVIVGVILMLLVIYPLMVLIACRENPFRLLRAIREPVLTAFLTRSSAAALPVSMRVAQEDLRIRSELSGFALPLGATINMDGVCIHLPVFAILAANLFDIPLGLGEIMVLILSVVFASIGTGGNSGREHFPALHGAGEHGAGAGADRDGGRARDRHQSAAGHVRDRLQRRGRQHRQLCDRTPQRHDRRNASVAGRLPAAGAGYFRIVRVFLFFRWMTVEI